MDSTAPPAPTSAIERSSWPIGVVLLLAAVARLYGVGAHDFWYDEAIEIVRERLPWPRLLLLTDGPDPPLYRILQSPIARATASEVWLRLPSVAFSVGTVWLLWRWIARLGDARLALLSAALLAIAPVQVHYAQEVSQYALAGAAGAWMLLAYQKVADDGRPRDWLLLSVAAVIGVLSYYGLLIVVLTIDLVLAARFCWRRERKQWAGLVASNAVVVAVVAALYWLMLARQFERFAGDHVLRLHSISESLALLGPMLEHDVLRFFWMPWSDGAPRLLILLPLLLTIAGAASLLARGPRWRMVVVLPVVALGGTWLAFVLGLYPFGFRYVFFLSPFLFVLVAEALRRAWAVPVVGAGLSCVVVATLVAFLPNVRLVPATWIEPPYENLAHVLGWVNEHAAPDDPIYLYYGARPAFGLYGDRTTLRVVRGEMFRQRPPQEKVSSLVASMRGADRFFVVVSHAWQDERCALMSGLAAPGSGYRVLASTEDFDAFAALVVADAAPAGLRGGEIVHRGF